MKLLSKVVCNCCIYLMISQFEDCAILRLISTNSIEDPLIEVRCKRKKLENARLIIELGKFN